MKLVLSTNKKLDGVVAPEYYEIPVESWNGIQLHHKPVIHPMNNEFSVYDICSGKVLDESDYVKKLKQEIHKQFGFVHAHLDLVTIARVISDKLDKEIGVVSGFHYEVYLPELRVATNTLVDDEKLLRYLKTLQTVTKSDCVELRSKIDSYGDDFTLMDLYFLVQEQFALHKMEDITNIENSSANGFFSGHLGIDAIETESIPSNGIFVVNQDFITEAEITPLPPNELALHSSSMFNRNIDYVACDEVINQIIDRYSLTEISDDRIPVYLPLTVQQGKNLLNTHHVTSDDGRLTVYGDTSHTVFDGTGVGLKVDAGCLTVDSINPKTGLLTFSLDLNGLNCAYMGDWIDYDSQITKQLISNLSNAQTKEPHENYAEDRGERMGMR
ncbi:hypothetical protein [Vibrio parahaemolyticus]|uniref:hypothetical protein n=1 Tax=Vibrio parahaemolyticus TaxID=670 RepID=UPI0015D2AF0E|nr:hypothetical protein [Vibrio parahaemolyticus]NYU23884.1 hypothetical protein [Vibrio parahaemolyticus]